MHCGVTEMRSSSVTIGTKVLPAPGTYLFLRIGLYNLTEIPNMSKKSAQKWEIINTTQFQLEAKNQKFPKTLAISCFYRRSIYYSLGDSNQIHFTQWQDPSEKAVSPHKTIKGWCNVALIFTAYDLKASPIRIDSPSPPPPKKNSKIICTGNSAEGDDFSKMYMCLFTFWMNGFCSLSFFQ